MGCAQIRRHPALEAGRVDAARRETVADDLQPSAADLIYGDLEATVAGWFTSSSDHRYAHRHCNHVRGGAVTLPARKRELLRCEEVYV